MLTLSYCVPQSCVHIILKKHAICFFVLMPQPFRSKIQGGGFI